VLKIGEVQAIEYTKDGGDQTTGRVIIPVNVPDSNIQALDVTDLNTEEQKQAADLVNEYNQYLNDKMSTVFSFEDWMEHTSQPAIPIKWRRFRSSGVKAV